jgi:hypothetical protein
LLEHPLVLWIVPKHPKAMRSSHHIQIIEIVAMRHYDWMVTARNHYSIMILNGTGLVQASVVRVNTLEGKSLGRVEPVVIDLFQLSFCWG